MQAPNPGQHNGVAIEPLKRRTCFNAFSYAEIVFATLPYQEAGSRHWNHFDVTNGQPDEEASPSLFHEYAPCHFSYTQPVAIADYTADLHPPSYHFQRIGHGLREEAGETSGGQLGPVLQLSGFVSRGGGLGTRGVRQGGVGGESGMAQQIRHCVVSEERSTCVGDHAEKGGCEAAEEVGHAGLWHTLFHHG